MLLDCKHKHMMKSGAPPVKIGVLVPCLISNFLETLWVRLSSVDQLYSGTIMKKFYDIINFNNYLKFIVSLNAITSEVAHFIVKWIVTLNVISKEDAIEWLIGFKSRISIFTDFG